MTMEKTIIIGCLILLFTVPILFTSCYYDSEEDLYPMLGCDTTNVTYSATVLPILQQNCYVCHSAAANNGNITLEGYTNLKRFVDNGQFLGAIKHLPGFSAMPQNAPKLLECNIEKIEVWVNDGAPDN